MQPVPGPHPPAHPPVLAARRPGQVPVISDLIHQRHQIAARLPGRDRVHHHPAHRREHAIDPPGPPRRDGPRPRQHQPGRGRAGPRSSRPGVREPGHEQPELPSARLPGPARAGTPAQEQRDRVRIALRRGLRAVTAEPHLPQEPIGDRHDSQVLIEHRPVPRAGRQPHRERPHLVIPRSRAGLHEQLPATSATPGETRRRTRHMTGSRNVMQQAGDPWRRHPDRGAARAQPPQPGPVPAALHRRARPAAADRPVQDRRRTAPGHQPRAGRRAQRDHHPDPRPGHSGAAGDRLRLPRAGVEPADAAAVPAPSRRRAPRRRRPRGPRI